MTKLRFKADFMWIILFMYLPLMLMDELGFAALVYE